MTVYVYYGWLHPAGPLNKKCRWQIYGLKILALLLLKCSNKNVKRAYHREASLKQNFLCFQERWCWTTSSDFGSCRCYRGVRTFDVPSGQAEVDGGSSLARDSLLHAKLGGFQESPLALDFRDLQWRRPLAFCPWDTRCICRWSCCITRGPRNSML